MATETEDERYDSHVWMVAHGQSWAIRRVWRAPDGGTILFFWRGYAPNLEYTAYDVTHVNWESYADKASQWLAEGKW